MTTLAAAEQEVLAFGWHDVTCPEGSTCRSRQLHATYGASVTLALVLRAVEASGIREAAKAEGLLEAAADIETDWAPAWGGDHMWFTTGTTVAELVADTLRAMALEVAS